MSLNLFVCLGTLTLLKHLALQKAMISSFIPFRLLHSFPPPTNPIIIQTNSSKLSINSFYYYISFYSIFMGIGITINSCTGKKKRN